MDSWRSSFLVDFTVVLTTTNTMNRKNNSADVTSSYCFAEMSTELANQLVRSLKISLFLKS